MSDSSKKSSKRKKGWVRRWATRIVLIAVALGVVGAVIYGLIPKPVKVESTEVSQGKMAVTVDDDGKTRVKDRYIISAPLAGDLSRIKLEPGDKIDEETVLATLLPVPSPLQDPQSRAQARARLSAASDAHRQAISAQKSAQAAFEFASSEIKTQRELADQGSIPGQELDRAELDLRTRKADLSSAKYAAQVARHQVAVARAALDRFRSDKSDKKPASLNGGEQMPLRAPAVGVVLDVMAESGGVVQPGTPIIEVGDSSALEVVVDVLTRDAVRVKPGDVAQIKRWGGEHTLEARVTRIEPKAFTEMSSLGVQEQRVNIILELTSAPEDWSALGDGYRVDASITVWQTDDALQVPASAVFRHDANWSVFMVDAGVARRRTVKIGHRNGVDVQILDGLGQGDVVILHPGEEVGDGADVERR